MIDPRYLRAVRVFQEALKSFVSSVHMDVSVSHSASPYAGDVPKRTLSLYTHMRSGGTGHLARLEMCSSRSVTDEQICGLFREMTQKLEKTPCNSCGSANHIKIPDDIEEQIKDALRGEVEGD